MLLSTNLGQKNQVLSFPMVFRKESNTYNIQSRLEREQKQSSLFSKYSLIVEEALL